jgi:hypothetical protein
MSTRSPQASRIALAAGFILTPGLVLAQGSETAKPFEMTSGLVLQMFGIGISAITVAWMGIVGLFAWKNALNDLLDLVKRGPVIKFVTVTYIIVVIVTLSLVGQLESSHVSTLLGAIAGYVLGDRGREERSLKHVGPEPRPSRAEPPSLQGKAPAAPLPPPAPQHASEGQPPPTELHS